MRSSLSFAAFLVCLVLLIYFYLLPGTEAMLDGRTDIVLSDGTDPASLPGVYDVLLQIWEKSPSKLFYGSVYSNYIDPELGFSYTVPWNERWIVVFVSQFFAIEQLSTAFSFVLLLLNGLAMFLLCRYLKWSNGLSSALAIAWAINSYNRARVKVHMALAGIYHLPLIFLGLYLVVRGRNKRSLVAATISFLLVGSVAHYYLFTCMFLSPFFLLFLYIQPEFKLEWRTICKRMTIAIAPLMMFLAWNYFKILPSEARVTGESVLNAGVAKEGEQDNFILYLRTFHARPIDYLAGDIALENNGKDLNPIRQHINEHILNSLENSNSHERSNGIRWSILLLTTMALVLLARRWSVLESNWRNNMTYFLIFGLFTLWMSLSPDFPFENSSPGYWLFSIFKKIRVSSRAGIQVHFALLMIVGFYLARVQKWKKWIHFPGALALVMIADYYPIQKMPMAEIQPAYSALNRSNGPCQYGMAFPFFSPYYLNNMAYAFTARMRGSDCPAFNLSSNAKRINWLTQQFPPTSQLISQLSTSSVTEDKLERLVKCVPLNWIAFHEVTPIQWVGQMCQRLGWKLYPDLTCVAPHKDQPMRVKPEDCALD